MLTIGNCVSILKATSRAVHLLILSIKRNSPIFRRTAELEDSGMDYTGLISMGREVLYLILP